MGFKKTGFQLIWTFLIWSMVLFGAFANADPIILFFVISISWFVGLYLIGRLMRTKQEGDVA